MFRAVSKLQHRGPSASLSSLVAARPRVAVPVQLSCYAGPLSSSSRDDTANETTPTSANVKAMLRSLHTTTTTSNYTRTSNQRGFRYSQSQPQFHPLLASFTYNTTGSTLHRGFATSAGRDDSGDTAAEGTFTDDSSSSVDATLEKLFQENATSSPTIVGDAVVSSSGMEFVPTWWPSDQCLQLIFKFQEVTGADSLALAIIGTTAVIRIGLFPIVAKTQKSASRMAHVQPEMEVLKKNFEKIKNPTMEDKAKMGKQVQELFKRYDVNPIQSMLMPFIQFPFFLGMFFGLKKMPDYFWPEMVNGGMLWFPDLTQSAVFNMTQLGGLLPEPNMTWVLPSICMLTFIASIELGKEQMMASNPAMAGNIMMFFRLMMLPMVYILANFHSGLLCYWTVNNCFTLMQISLLKTPAVKNAMGIWDPPKPVPGLAQAGGLKEAMDKFQKYAAGEPTTEAGKMEQHNQRIEQQKKQTELSRQSRAANRRRSIKKR